MNYISMFSGIEAASVAFSPLGWDPICFAEIEAFPAAVLNHHYPDVPNVGDMTAHDWSQYRGHCALVVGGPPCQAFSVAGLRLSLDDDRGNLSLRYMKAIHAIDPIWSITENVPGWLSTKDNAFGCFLAGLVGEDAELVPPGGRWTDAGVASGPERTAAWRCLDAQYFGLAQRRKRVFVLSVRGSGNWRCAEALFPLTESVPRNPPPRREAGQGIAPTIAARTKGGGGLGTDFDCDGGLIANTLSAARGAACANAADLETYIPVRSMCLNAGGMGRQDSESETLIAHSLRAEGFDASEDGTGRGTPIIPIDLRQASRGEKITNNRAHGSGGAPGHGIGNAGDPAFTVSERGQAIAFSAKDHGADAGEISPTLRSGGHDKSHANGGVMPAVAFEWQRGATQNLEMLEEQAPALIKSQTPAVAFNSDQSEKTFSMGEREEQAPTLRSGGEVSVSQASSVRRLTPRECERLQGFPEIVKSAIILVCSSAQIKTAVLAEIQNPKSQTYASLAVANELLRDAGNAESLSHISLLGRERPVALNVHIDLEREAVRLHSRGRLLWSASNAVDPNWSRLPTQPENFVLLSALLTRAWEAETQGGRAASPASINSSSPLLRGSVYALASGPENEAVAKDVLAAMMRPNAFTKSTTSEVGPSSQACELNPATWPFCATAVTSGFIPSETLSADLFAITLSTARGYTAVPYRGKPAADGPRYKALGNSMAVPCMRWIGERIQMAEAA